MNSKASPAGCQSDSEASTISEDQVVNYLRQNPDFFARQDDLLAEISLPHDSGNAISLLERQVNILRARGTEARQKLNNLLENARNNDQLFDTTQNLVLALLRAADATEIAEIAQDQLSNHANVDACELIVAEQEGLDVAPTVRTQSSEHLKAEFEEVFRLKRTHCGSLDRERSIICSRMMQAQSAQQLCALSSATVSARNPCTGKPAGRRLQRQSRHAVFGFHRACDRRCAG